MKRVLVSVAVFSGVVLVSNGWGRVEAGEGQTAVSAPGAAPALVPRPAAGGTAAETQPAPKPPVAEGALAKAVALEFNGNSLTECCAHLEEISKLKIGCSKELADARITLRMSRAPLVAVIRWLARLSGAKAYELPDRSIVITKQKPDGGAELLYEADDSEEWKKELEKKFGKKVTFEFVQAPLSEALDFLRQVGEFNLVLDPAIKDEAATPITLKMNDAGLGLALAWITQMSNCSYQVLDHAVYVTKAGAAKGPAPAKTDPPAPAVGPGTGTPPAREARPEVF